MKLKLQWEFVCSQQLQQYGYYSGVLDPSAGYSTGIKAELPYLLEEHYDPLPAAPAATQHKTDEDFSVILADVRKTCYSSWAPQ